MITSNALSGRILHSLEAWAVFCTSFLFFLMLAIGPYPIEIGGVLVDRLASATALVLLLLGSKSWKDSYRWALVLVSIAYLLTLIPSVLLAKSLDIAMERYVIFAAYGLTFILVLLNRHKYIVVMRVTALLAVLSAVGIIQYVFYVSDFYEGGRFALAASAEDLETLYDSYGAKGVVVDPAHTAFGLILTFMMGLPLLHDIRKPLVRALLIIAFLGVLSGEILLFSRTAAVSIFLGMILGAFYYFHYARWRPPLSFVAVNFIVAVMIVALIASHDEVFSRLVEVWLNRFGGGIERESDAGGRLTLIAADLECFSTDISTILIGCGYAGSNPHNELVRNLANSGLIALLAVTLLLVGTYWISRKLAYRSQRHMYVDVAFWPFLFMLLTYGHVKTFWAGLAIIWLAGIPNGLQPGQKRIIWSKRNQNRFSQSV